MHTPDHKRARARLRTLIPKRGSALVLTLYTVAILLVLGTSYIAMSASERRATKGDKNATLGKQAAVFGVNWALTYMSHVSHWSQPVADTTNGVFQYGLVPGTQDNGTWLGLDYTLTPQAYDAALAPTGVTTGGWRISLKPQPNLLWNVVESDRLKRMTAQIDLIVWPYRMAGKPEQYIVNATAQLYTGDFSAGTIPAGAQPAFTRSVFARVREFGALDFSVFEANARTWDASSLNAAEKNTSGGVDTPPSPKAPPKPADSAGPDAQAAWAQETNNRQSLYGAWQAAVTAAYGAIGVPAGYQSDGNIRIDGAANNTWKGSTAGTIASGASVQEVDGTLRFFDTTGVKLNGDVTHKAGLSNAFAAGQDPSSNAQAYNPFLHGDLSAPSRGLPQAGTQNYLDTVTADSSGNVSKAPGFASQLANSQAAGTSGYIKVSTPATGAVGVSPGAGGTGAAVEFDSTGSNKQPGFAKIQVTFDSANHPGQILVEQRGAYSGGLVPGSSSSIVGTSGSSGWVSVDSIKNGMLYVDGGNVEVKGSVDKSVSIIATASSDRPTVTNNGNDAPQRIDYSAPGTSASLPGSIYRKADDPIFSSGTVPARDPSTNKFYWPAWDPKKYDPDSPNPILRNMDPYSKSALVREGNISIVGDLKKSGSTSSTASIGLIAQNNIILNDQTPNKSTLRVDATLMSTQRSVQYAGLLPQTGSGTIKDYFDSLGYPNIPPRNQVSNGTFELNGSIIGQFADVESTQSGMGYTTQKMKADRNAQNSPPPGFPQFSRVASNELISWVVVMMTDNSAATTQ